jgi:polysaccharide biosynthesis/export protein
MSKGIKLCTAVAIAMLYPAISMPGQNSVPDGAGAPPDRAAAQQTTNTSSSVGLQERYPRYQILPGDTMDLVFEFSPEFNQSVSVQPDGYISLRGVGDVHVSSETIPELIATLEKAYSKILNKPSISVMLKDFEKPYFTVTGQVGRPGKYDLHGETTVTEAVAMAGGFNEKSKHSHVVLFRRVSSQWTEAKVLDVKKMLNSGNLGEDFVMHPGDMVYVPQNKISKISRYIPTSSLSTYVSPTAF